MPTRRSPRTPPASHDIRRATFADAAVLGAMLDAFNREFAAETPGPEALATRLDELLRHDAGALSGHGTVALLGASGTDRTAPAGFAILRVRPSLYSPALEAYLAELYVVPPQRGRGLGRTLLERSLALARELGADRIELGTSDDDHAARALYESAGFINREDGPEGPIMYVYEREL